KIVILAFIIFRIFDIAKPFPAGISQRLKGGLGIVADDIIAGIYTNLAIIGIKFGSEYFGFIIF
ncbi:phosphatidylglycerophosphatase A, partial [Spirochaetota bacterium]